jgi:putative autotransporter adhesin-like protein
MRKSIAAATLAACAATSSCGQVHADAGRTVSRNYQVGNFQEIEAAGPYDINVQTGGNPSVSARGPEKVLDNITVEVEGDKLVIGSKNHGFFNFGWGSRGRTVFTVTVPTIRAAMLAGSGDLTVNSVSGDSFAGTLAGSGDLSVGSVNVKSLKLSVAGSGDAKAGGGQAQTAEYSTAGSGDIDARGVTTQQLKVSIAGSGDIKGHATGAAEVKIMGSGDVTVTGGAKCSFEKHGSGDLDCS